MVIETGVKKHKRKKLLTLISSIVLITLALLFMFFARNPVISVGKVSGAAGEIIDVPVSISRNSGIAAMVLWMNFDNTYLEPIAVMKSELLRDGLFVENVSTASQEMNSVNVTWGNASNFKGNGVLYTVRFRVKREFTGDIPLTLTTGRETSNEKINISNEKLERVNHTLRSGLVKPKY